MLAGIRVFDLTLSTKKWVTGACVPRFECKFHISSCFDPAIVVLFLATARKPRKSTFRAGVIDVAVGEKTIFSGHCYRNIHRVARKNEGGRSCHASRHPGSSSM